MYRSNSISTVNKNDLTRSSGSSGAASVWAGSYDIDVGHIKQTGYLITSSSTDPRNPTHNYVQISAFFGRDEQPGEVIINSFDINCVQISIDLKNKTVHWSKDFQNFLYSKEFLEDYHFDISNTHPNCKVIMPISFVKNERGIWSLIKESKEIDIDISQWITKMQKESSHLNSQKHYC